MNGKRYDALTGRLLGDSTSPIVEPLPPRPRNIDGVVKVKPETKRVEPKPSQPSTPSHPEVHRKTGQPLKAHHPQHAKTLKRSAVEKPKTEAKANLKAKTHAEIAAKPVSTIARKHSALQVDEVRLHRAHQTPQSEAIRRFTLSAVNSHDVLPSQVIQPTQTAAVRASHHPEEKHPEPDIFEAAIARANSHEQPPHKTKAKHPKKKRAVGIMAGIAAFLVMGGFLAYLNMPKLELKVASFQAGFAAHMPGYNLTGYRLADIENHRGKVTLSFHSGDSSYQITQQASNWNSQTLQDDIIATAGHEKVQSKGRTIYLYDGIASWISGGVRYDISGNAHLSPDEIVDIATSM